MRFYAREKELKILNDSFNYQGFKMLVMYGRRRVGKSYLLQHFFNSVNAKTIAFQAIQHDTKQSINAFKETMLDIFPNDYELKLDSWKDCFNYLNNHLSDEKIIICIDEINYIFEEDPSFASQLQNEIDNYLIHHNVFLIVCGSSINSIEKEIMKENAPLYGRRSLSIKLEEFTYLEASQFYDNYSNEEKVNAYAVFGGKGKYLNVINPNISVKENIINEILTPGGGLADEIDLLLKDDFRDPSFYKELLHVISIGNTTFNDIVTQMNADNSKVATYLNKLVDIRMIIKKSFSSHNKRNEYRYFIQDNFLSFYFRFIYRRRNILNILVSPEAYYERFIKDDLNSFVGLIFENICEQYLVKQSFEGKLDFIPLEYGKYWGKHRDGRTFDIDVVFKNDNNAIVGECKFTSKEFTTIDMLELINNAKTLKVNNIEYYVFSKSGVKKEVKERYINVNYLSLDDLYNK